MSTAGERLEATVWLESNAPNINSAQRAAFLSAVDDYYGQDPDGERSADALDCIQQDERMFAEILSAVLVEVPPSPSSPPLDLP